MQPQPAPPRPARTPQGTTESHGPNKIARRVVRSCHMCHRRKVKCDKKSPCSNCTRNGVLCCYPSNDRPPAPRQPKSTIADIASRLGQLERTLVALSTADGNGLGVDQSLGQRGQSAGPTRSPVDDGEDSSSNVSSPAASSVDELLVKEGSSSRYVNEILFSRVLEEEGEIRTVMATPRPADTGTNVRHIPVTPPNLGVFFPGAVAAADIKKLCPPPYQAMHLWNVFLRNVDPVTKVLHIPTVQIDIFTAIKCPNETASDVLCLLFAIFFAAVTSLPPDETFHMLGEEKNQALNRFKEGVEQSLIRANILENPTVRALQGLGIFLKVYRAHNIGRAPWILNGLTIRAAQSIGLHRDGSKLKLSPFEAEMRRRLWWYLDDGRSSEDHGIIINSGTHSASDVNLPLNIDDGSLDPNMTSLPPPSPRWTDMSIACCIYETARTHKTLQRVLYSSSSSPSEEKRKAIIDELTTRVEALLQYCNPVIPIQRAALVMARTVLHKADFISRQQWKRATRPGETPDTDDSLLDAVELLELNQKYMKDELMRNYAWIGECYPQYHAMLYVLWHLSLHPEGQHVERAWAALKGSFEQENARQMRQLQGGSGSKWAIIQLMREKALRMRELSRGGADGDQAGVAEGRQQKEMSPPNRDAGKDVPTGTTFADEETLVDMESMGLGNMDWDGGTMDWTSLLEGFGGYANGDAHGY